MSELSEECRRRLEMIDDALGSCIVDPTPSTVLTQLGGLQRKLGPMLGLDDDEECLRILGELEPKVSYLVSPLRALGQPGDLREALQMARDVVRRSLDG